MQDSSNTYFVADVHLAEERPKVTQSFIKFCDAMTQQQATLFILGDLFDAWLGDDMMGEMEKQVLQAIKSITESGGQTFFIAGNRDFLVGKDFFTASSLKELGDTELLAIAGKRALLLHGDGLCILDKVHQSQRKLARTDEWKQGVLAKSPEERMRLKQEYFAISNTHVKDTNDQLLQIPDSHINKLLMEQDLDMMIYGHIHEPQTRIVSLQGKQRQVMCLGDWGNQDNAWFGKMVGPRVELYHLPLQDLFKAHAPEEVIQDQAIKVA